MKNIVLIFVALIAIQAVAFSSEFDFSPDKPIPAPGPKSAEKIALQSSGSMELIERDIDELFRRVDELERTKIDASEAEKIAEKVFKRLSIVLNKSDGGQELQTFNVPISDGTVIKTTLGPGQTFGTLVDPVNGQVVHFGAPRNVVVQNQSLPVQEFVSQDYVVRQTEPASDGTRVINVRVGTGPVSKTCKIVNGEVVCESSSSLAVPSFETVTAPQSSRPVLRRILFGARR